ncbi:MAG: hypothetical protein AB1556_07875 [Bacillota bacterium]
MLEDAPLRKEEFDLGRLAGKKIALVTHVHPHQRWPEEGPSLAVAREFDLIRNLFRMDTYYVYQVKAEDLRDYDLIILIHFAPDFPELLFDIKRTSRTKVALLIDGGCEYFTWFPVRDLRLKLAWLKECDLVLTWSATKTSFLSMFTGAPVVSLDNPAPVHHLVDFIVPREKREPRVLVNGSLGLHWNGLTSLMVALEAGMPVDVLQQDILHQNGSRDEEKVQFYESLARKYRREIRILPYMIWYPDFIKQVSRYYLAVCLDARTVSGRFTGDLASVGVPVVGSNTLEQQRECFPEITVPPYDGAAARAKVARLLRDNDFYEHVCRYAIEKKYRRSNYRRFFRTLRDALEGLFENIEKLTTTITHYNH